MEDLHGGRRPDAGLLRRRRNPGSGHRRGEPALVSSFASPTPASSAATGTRWDLDATDSPPFGPEAGQRRGDSDTDLFRIVPDAILPARHRFAVTPRGSYADAARGCHPPPRRHQGTHQLVTVLQYVH